MYVVFPSVRVIVSSSLTPFACYYGSVRTHATCLAHLELLDALDVVRVGHGVGADVSGLGIGEGGRGLIVAAAPVGLEGDLAAALSRYGQPDFLKVPVDLPPWPLELRRATLVPAMGDASHRITSYF